jgi:pyruvate,water dikinase
MNYCLFLEQVSAGDLDSVGGKASALADLARLGLGIPKSFCLARQAYDAYLQSTGLGEQIFLELNRKSFDTMRWEEIWDLSLRIRSLFLRAPLPGFLGSEIQKALDHFDDGISLAVRSSAPGEDSQNRSFAGLHESYINIKGLSEVLKHVRLVWASLWSDRALLYRRELRLDALESSMAVLVQEMIDGEASGVVFGQSPMDAESVVIEAVHGLNQGLVDGAVEPDQWIIKGSSGELINHKQPVRVNALRLSTAGASLLPLEGKIAKEPPLAPDQVVEVFELAGLLEQSFGLPQDTEWTYSNGKLVVLQSRPITTLDREDKDQERQRYLGLTRSLENLKSLRSHLKQRLLPEMEQRAAQMAQIDLASLTDVELAQELGGRQDIFNHYKAQYFEYCIPFAHGMRLFAQVYNDLLTPEDPYEFMDLLSGEKLISTARNQRLGEIALYLKDNKSLQEKAERGESPGDAALEQMVKGFLRDYSGGGWADKTLELDAKAVYRLVFQMSLKKEINTTKKETLREKKQEVFIRAFGKERQKQAIELLDLARDSYSLRDNDNIYLGRLEGLMLAARNLAKERLSQKTGIKASAIADSELIKGLYGQSISDVRDMPEIDSPAETEVFASRARQLVGQPAGPGLAVGKARVLLDQADLLKFQAGEVLVTDAVDPNMTFVAPLAVAVVERRGGMLIHGAIIAREYGLPCITGVPRATELIKTGDLLTVDGHLGLVIVGEPSLVDDAMV